MTDSYPPGSISVSEPNMAPGSSRFMPRRSSYASIVTGNSWTISQSHGSPMGSTPFPNSLDQNIDTGQNSFQTPMGQSRYDFRQTDTTPGLNEVNNLRRGTWLHGSQLPSSSGAFEPLMNENGSANTQETDIFFTPSYLKGSIYIQKLEEEYKARNETQKNSAPVPPSQTGSLSTSTSKVAIHEFTTYSHRGSNFDLIEKAPSTVKESIPPLPSRWSSHDKQSCLELLSDGLEIKLTGLKTEREHESCAVRANHPMPTQCGIYYFEVTILAREREESSIGIGFSSKNVPLTRLPGWEPESWAYHGDDGHSYCSQPSGKSYGPSFTTNDIIGCGINFRNNSAFFTKNGDHLGTAFRDVRGKLYPSVGMKKPGEHVKVNFGQSPFVFDIDSILEREKNLIEREIKSTSTLKLAPHLCETEFIQALVLQFFIHDGYVDTARAFAKEIFSEKKALNLDPQAVVPKYDMKEDEDAGHRQQIRTAILDGDIETALQHTNAHYPQVLKDNKQVYFRLRCRKFVEMIREAAETQNNIINNEMYEDEDPYQGNCDRMETEENHLSHSYHTRLLQETINYGTELSAEFRDDPRKEVKKALEDAFALMAYQEPLKAKGVAYLLDPNGRVAVAEELNSAILQSLGKPSSAALERLCQETTILLEDLREKGGSAAALLNVNDYINPY